MQFFLYARKSTDEDDRQLLSIESQLVELREFAKKESLNVSREFIESKTAKVPGRPIFNQMIKEIEAGEVHGILSWHPDRLARNSVDGGKIIYLVDTDKIISLKFPTFWFENTPQGKFMLNIAFGQSKYYVDNLSENIRRGIRQKLRRGEYPGKPPIGYLNEPRLRNIVVDEKKAPLVKKMFEEFATGKFTQRQIRDLAASWGLVGPKGKPLALSKIVEYLSHPFYVGMFRYSGELYEGSHEPIITKKLFDQVQKVLAQRGKPQSLQKDSKPFLGLLHCGECGCSITAEKQKGNHYYRCTKKKGPCSLNRYVREEVLSDWLRDSIHKVSLPDSWIKKMMARIEKWKVKEAKDSRGQIDQCQIKVSQVQAKLDRLLDVYLEGSVSREEYLSRKETLLIEKRNLLERVSVIKSQGNVWLEPLETFIKQVGEAKRTASSENPKDLKDFHQNIGSNLVLVANSSKNKTKKTLNQLENSPHIHSENWIPIYDLRGGFAARSDQKNQKNSKRKPIPPSSNSKLNFKNFGLKIQSQKSSKPPSGPLPELLVHYPKPWNFLAERRPGEEWWSKEGSNFGVFK